MSDNSSTIDPYEIDERQDEPELVTVGSATSIIPAPSAEAQPQPEAEVNDNSEENEVVHAPSSSSLPRGPSPSIVAGLSLLQNRRRRRRRQVESVISNRRQMIRVRELPRINFRPWNRAQMSIAAQAGYEYRTWLIQAPHVRVINARTRDQIIQAISNTIQSQRNRGGWGSGRAARNRANQNMRVPEAQRRRRPRPAAQNTAANRQRNGPDSSSS
ncbi:uncharacterized protein LOC115625997 [Scaptodrosophila lebanonensis]|uniref:Uncharacterized protein LOC115625997 n=1 Tax=Drosophila lebanonensis TaxID=7225 RepID=A0A6J2TQ69_DROLE|nr:uncharacterized protein LOC115625997 [Scaptodrosophila lebanonensis]XP_030377103.1 uncharacterized protein LOC115625997 [Scaptodrosophila lebanonensis]